MKDLEWKNVLGKRVLVVDSYGSCGVGRVLCAFDHVFCFIPSGRFGNKAACDVFATKNNMFITEDQLPAYLEQKLMGRS